MDILVDASRIKTHKVNFAKAYKYAKDMEKGDIFPAIKAYRRNGQWFCKNGAHRVYACRMLNKKIEVKSKKEKLVYAPYN